MATDDIERLHYYQGQYLGALDFENQQAYHREMRRRLNLAHHSWGIVTGLELTSTNSTPGQPTDISINPGMAIDGYGREIVVFQPQQLDPADFQFSQGANYYTVCLEYTEVLKQSPQAGYGQCNQLNNQFGRVVEAFHVVVKDASRDDIMVNGQAASLSSSFTSQTDAEDVPILSQPGSSSSSPNGPKIPLDESVPYQELPSDDPTIPKAALWRIPLGKVWWDSKSSKTQFIVDKLHVAVSDEGRHYIGAIASRLFAPAGKLVVRNRKAALPFKPSTPDGVEMIIEGTLQVDRVLTAKDDIQIHSHALDFRTVDGYGTNGLQDDKTLFAIFRNDPGAAKGTDLRIKIGEANAGTNRFVVGTANNNDLFTVDDSGNAQFTGPLRIKTDLIVDGILDFGSQPRQMIKLWSSNDNKQQNGIGIVMNGGQATTYFRSSDQYWWFKGSAFDASQNDPGHGAQVQLKLDADGSLHFDNDLDAPNRLRQMLNLSSTKYGIGVQTLTLYFRSDSSFCWFRRGLPNPAAGEPGTGGQLQLKLDDQGSLHFDNDSDAPNRLRQMLNLSSTDYGIGVQTSTLYLRSDADFCWFRGGSPSTTANDPGARGQLQLRLDSQGSLHFDNDSDAPNRLRQMLNLSSTRYGIGVQASTLYSRSDADFCWFRGGSPSPAANDPGAGGQLQLRLDSKGDLYFGQHLTQMLNLWSTGYGIGIQASTLYSRSDADFCWFRGGSPSTTANDPGAGGQLQLRLDSQGSLHFDNDADAPNRLRQMLNLSSSKYGIGVQASTLYSRSDSDFCWYRGGSPSPAANDSGGGTLQMRLDRQGDLYFGQHTTQMLNLWSTGYGIGIQDSTLYFRSDFDFCWFQGGSPSATIGDPGGGTRHMKLDRNGALEVSGKDQGHIAFTNTDRNHTVTIGRVSLPFHGADSVYGDPNLWLDTAGTVIIKSGFTTANMDGSEHFPYSEPVEPGDVVVLSTEGGRHVKPAEKAYDGSVVGVVSTDPGFILGGPTSAHEIEAGQGNNAAVALIGTVPCKVDADIAPIHIGDLLATSPTKGHAQKVLDMSKATGAVLGKAMGNLENGKGLVPILIVMC